MTDPTRDLVRELVGLRKARRSGYVEIRTGDLTTTLVLADGEVIAVKASTPGEPLGRILTRKGLLTQDQYIDALERMSGALAVGERVRFGEIVVELGYADPAAVRRCLTEQQRTLASRVFGGSGPTWTFREAPVVRDTASEATMEIEALFLDAVRWLDAGQQDALRPAESRGAPIAAIWDLDEIDARFDLTDAESAFVRTALSGEQTLAALLDDGGANDTVDVHALLTALLATGAASPAAQPKSPAQRSTRPPLPRPQPAGPAWKIDAERARTALAKVVLAKIPVVASPVDASRSVEHRLRSEQAFQRGKELLRAGRIGAALVELERAWELDPESAEYELFATWARYAGRLERLDGSGRAKLEALARKALGQSSKLAFGYFVLGEVLRESGEVEEARRHLRHALRLEPDLFAGLRSHRLGEVRGSQPSIETDRVVATTPPPVVEGEGAVPADAPASAAQPVAEAQRHEAAPAVEPPPHAVTTAEPSPSRAAPGPSRRAPKLLMALAVVVVGASAAIAIVVANGSSGAEDTRPHAPPGPRGPAAAPNPTPGGPPAMPLADDAPAAAPVAPSPLDAATNDADPSGQGEIVGARPDGSAPQRGDAVEARTGTMVLGASAIGHRVFVDGHVLADLDGGIVVTCGRHDVRVGSHGKSVSVDVPCGGERALP